MVGSKTSARHPECLPASLPMPTDSNMLLMHVNMFFLGGGINLVFAGCLKWPFEELSF